jgi:hypothetical protein
MTQHTEENKMALFKRGQPRPANSGRRKGSRDKIATTLLEAIAKDFEEHGEEVIKIARVERPAEYLKLCASLIPIAFDENAPLQLGVTHITRTIIDPGEHQHTPWLIRRSRPHR